MLFQDVVTTLTVSFNMFFLKIKFETACHIRADFVLLASFVASSVCDPCIIAGPNCKNRHVRKASLCALYMAGFCPDGPRCKFSQSAFFFAHNVRLSQSQSRNSTGGHAAKALALPHMRASWAQG